MTDFFRQCVICDRSDSVRPGPDLIQYICDACRDEAQRNRKASENRCGTLLARTMQECAK